MAVNCSNVLKLLMEKYPPSLSTSHYTRKERELAKKLDDILWDYREGETLEFLDFALDGIEDMSDDEESLFSDDEVSSEEDFEEPPPKRQVVNYTPEQWEKIFNMVDKKWSLATIRSKYPQITNLRQIKRKRDSFAKGGAISEKYATLDEQVFEKFSSWRKQRMAIHDRDLIEQGLILAKKLDLPRFKASESWVYRFKKRHRIVSRKITTYVSKKKSRAPINPSDIENFRLAVRDALKRYDHFLVRNTDQTAMKQEVVTGGTLEFKGVKIVEAGIQRSNAITHSYTIQPVISADGTLHLPVYVNLAEPNAPQIFHQQLSEFSNIVFTHSKSGILSTDHARDWLNTQFLPNMNEKGVLMCDDWNGFKKPIREVLTQDPAPIEVLFIPPGTTSQLQPLDLFFNRQLKAFIKILSDKIRRSYDDFVVSNRAGIGRILNVTMAQFAAPCFKPMIRYSWYSAGYLDERPEGFMTPVQVCFDSLEIDSLCSCSNRAFIMCAHCNSFLCFHHFLIDMHGCK